MRFLKGKGDACRASLRQMDHSYLLLVLLLLTFGAVMSYSASAVYGVQFYGDSLYFFKRYLLFALLSLVASAPFALFATPCFWRRFASARA
jgi:cell division protein FtsW